jgi:hypothetical protein
VVNIPKVEVLHHYFFHRKWVKEKGSSIVLPVPGIQKKSTGRRIIIFSLNQHKPGPFFIAGSSIF